LLKDLKMEADKMKARKSVQSGILAFFKMDKWDEASTRFRSWVDDEKLLRFTVSQNLNTREFCCEV